jgi:6-phosphogluconolactonase
MIKHIDDRRSALILKQDQLITFLTDLFYQELNQALKTKGRFNVALSGGSTPKKLYETVCRDARAYDTLWDQVYIYYGDERAVPLDHSDSNYHMSLEAGFKNLKNIHLIPMEAYLNDPHAALDYQKKLPPFLDLIFLGMGEDGHTASLFPDDPLTQIIDRSCVFGFVKAKNSARMSLTLPYINQSSKILLLIVGQSKQNMLKQVLSPGDQHPCALVGTKTNPALYLLDEAAGSFL